MAKELIGNLLVAQSGGPTAVVNSTLAGVINEALNYECIEEIYGSINGISGILFEDLVDLAAESQQTIRGLRYTPGCALGSTRRVLKRSEELDRVINVFEAHNIRFFVYIGGSEAAETLQKISERANARNYDLLTVLVPKTIDNNLPVTDHCPGYGSAIKYVATTVRELALDHEAMGEYDLVSIVEVMGRNSGWIAAGATLAKHVNDLDSAPHLVYLPESSFSPDKFISDVKNILSKSPFCTVVVGEVLTDDSGNYIDLNSVPGAEKSSGQYLSALVKENLGIKTRYTKLGIAQRSAAHISSQVDNDHAYLTGEKAVKAIVDGESEIAITLTRGETDHYSCETSIVPCSEITGNIKYFPKAWINEDNSSISFHFYKYAIPLIQGEVKPKFENGLPSYVRLSCEYVDKQLSEYSERA